MESAKILTPPSTNEVFCFLSEPNINMKIYQHYINARGEVLSTPLDTTAAVAISK